MPLDLGSYISASADSADVIRYLVCLALLLSVINALLSPANLRHIPTVGGPSFPFMTYKGAFNVLRDIKGVLRHGYEKYKNQSFKIAFPDRWVVVVTGKRLVDELQRLPDDTASFIQATSELTAFGYIFGQRMREDPFHVPMIGSRLTKHLTAIFGEIDEEIHAAFQDYMPDCGDEWTPVHVIDVARDVVARASNRVFVGLPVCRNPKYLDMLVHFAVDVARTRNFIVWTPAPLKTLVSKTVTNIDGRLKEGMQYLRPVIEERTGLMKKFGDSWSDKPDDMLQWIIDEVVARNAPAEDILRNILFINFAAIHTSSNSFTFAMYHLAANPEFIGPLREEMERVIAAEGWTKTAMGRMWRLDSFLRESQRVNSINPLAVQRMALKPVTFSDGTYIPAGTVLATPAYATHFDDENYADAATFDPWRYVREKEQDLSPSKHQFVTLTSDYVPFGLGKHACPGRFFAANELKIMMTYVVMNYDVKFEQEGVRPENVHLGLAIMPDPKAKVLFRKRRSGEV